MQVCTFSLLYISKYVVRQYDRRHETEDGARGWIGEKGGGGRGGTSDRPYPPHFDFRASFCKEKKEGRSRARQSRLGGLEPRVSSFFSLRVGRPQRGSVATWSPRAPPITPVRAPQCRIIQISPAHPSIHPSIAMDTMIEGKRRRSVVDQKKRRRKPDGDSLLPCSVATFSYPTLFWVRCLSIHKASSHQIDIYGGSLALDEVGKRSAQTCVCVGM